MYMIGCVVMAVFGFIYFALLDTKVPGLIFLAVALSGLPVMTLYGPEAALIAEKLLAALALQRLLARLSAGLDHCRGSVAVHLDGVVRRLRFEFANCVLHPRLCRHRHRRDSAADGLHQ
jgi:hypothetical protein